jgi:hypothetical protein
MAAAAVTNAATSGREEEQKLSIVEDDAGPALRTMLMRTSCGFKASLALETAAAASPRPQPPPPHGLTHFKRSRAADRKATTWRSLSASAGAVDMCVYL